MTSRLPLSTCRAARVPLDGLRALAPLRAKRGVKIHVADHAWVEWETERPDVVAALLAVPGVVLLERRDGRWHSLGHHLPDPGPTNADEPISIDRAIVPAPIEAIASNPRESKRLPLQLVRSETPRLTTAIRCSIESLQPWADTATSADIESVHGIRCGSIAWLRGPKLPTIDEAERLWGEQVWRPNGWRTDPDWPEEALREAAGVGPNEILVLMYGRTEAIPLDAFRPLTRAAIRLATS